MLYNHTLPKTTFCKLGGLLSTSRHCCGISLMYMAVTLQDVLCLPHLTDRQTEIANEANNTDDNNISSAT